MAIDENKEMILNGDRKVKVEKGFVSKIKSFWKNIFKKKENKKTMGALEKLGVKIESIIKRKPEEEIIAERQAVKEIKKFDEEFESLINKLETQNLTEEEIDEIVARCEEMKQEKINEFDELLDYTENKQKLKIEKDDYMKNSARMIREAAIIARGNMIKEENQDEEIQPYATSGGDTYGMPLPIDDNKTITPDIESPLDMELDEPELDEPDLEVPIISNENEEPEMDNKEDELEEPTTSEGIDITDEITNDSIDLSDLTQFATYSDYRIAYCQTRIDEKDIHRFYNDLFANNYPSDFLDERSFAIEKQRQEDEIEYKKLEAERAEAEKQLREIEEKQAALSEEHAELQARFNDRDARLSALRKDNVSLKQKLVDKEGQIKDKEQEISGLQGQLTAAQEVAKKAQAQSYKDRKSLSDIEKELNKERAHAKELAVKLQTSEKEAAETKKELEATRARISENTEAALKQINSLRTPSDDDIEKTALDWAEKQIKETPKEKEEKKGPKHFAEKKPKHVAPKEETKVETTESEKKAEEKKETPSVEEPKPVIIKGQGIETPKEFAETTIEEPQVIGVSTTPDVEFQGVVTQDKDGHVNFETKPLTELQTEKADLEAKKADLIDAINKEAEGINNSEGTKTR